MKYPKRSERRAAWREANRNRPFDRMDDAGTLQRVPKAPWSPSTILTPLQAHLLRTRGRAHHQATLEVSLGFNRAQRRALHSKAGSKTLVTSGWKGSPTRVPKGNGRPRVQRYKWERETSTPAQSFRFGPRWNRHALRIEAFRRLQARVAAHKARNVWWRRLARLLRLLFWVAPVVLVRRGVRKIRGAR